MSGDNFKSGFVSVIGSPNAGKSTFVNAMLGQKLSIVTPKVQTTRHRILGILNEKNMQIIFSDTPGILEPTYELQKKMMHAVNRSLNDADLIVLIIDGENFSEKIYRESLEEKVAWIIKSQIRLVILLNKIDLMNSSQVEVKKQLLSRLIPNTEIIAVSALRGTNLKGTKEKIIEKIPVHPPYFSDERLSDRPEKFFASEIIREKIFLNYREEIPYSTEITITEYKEKENIDVIRAEIITEKKSQKEILIGRNGSALKKIGTEARVDIEKFVGRKVFLELHVKVSENWRNKKDVLKKLGYE